MVLSRKSITSAEIAEIEIFLNLVSKKKGLSDLTFLQEIFHTSQNF